MKIAVRWFTNPTEYKTQLTDNMGGHSLLKAEPIVMSEYGYTFVGQPGMLMYPALFWTTEKKPEKKEIEALITEYARRFDFKKMKSV